MFYYFVAPYLTYNFILVLAAVIPAVYLLIKVYRMDRLEKEDSRFLWNLVKAGIFSSLIALTLERIFVSLLNSSMNSNSFGYRILLYFVVVGLSEEGAKYFMLKKTSWNSREFNCLYDGLVYAVFVSLGFALWENISYVLHFGLANAFVRAFTAIPGHASFGVFMGVFYSAARLYANAGYTDKSKMFETCAVVIPMLIHGLYDYIATTQTTEGSWTFLAFIAILFFASNKVIKSASQNDRYFR
ncbi:MAG: PrsW family intramembrane metalloprotease [Erysipelotrichaceae bacterium]|nr:PrsW family intramembrane metalloprotease [Erysipelotrichaceae bacterium]